MTDLETINGEVTEELSRAVELVAPPSNLFKTDDPTEVIRKASEIATALATVIEVKKLYVVIGKKKHVLVEGWSLLGSMLGVFPVCEWTRKLEDGWEARVVATTLSGAVVGAAEAECLRSELLWKTRDDYALRSMAQTRATSKALRQPLGFVVTLAGYSATPAEEMPRDEARIEGPSKPKITSWKGLKEFVETYGADIWQSWVFLTDEAVRNLFGPEATRDKLEKEQRDELFVKSVVAAQTLAEGFDPNEVPPPNGFDLVEAWAVALDGAVLQLETEA